jgi:hypothetical protein
VLLLDGALATALALGFAARHGALARVVGCQWCVAYGLWSAAMFRLAPPMPTEHVLYFSNSTSPDAPFIVVAAVMHGLATVILAAPFARRVVHARGPGAAADQEILELAAGVTLVFFVVTAVARVAVELR